MNPVVGSFNLGLLQWSQETQVLCKVGLKIRTKYFQLLFAVKINKY